MRTLAELFDAYLADVRVNHEVSTQYQQRLFFTQVVQDLGPLPLDAVTPDVLRAWKGRMTLRYKPATIYRYMAFLSCAFRWGIEADWLPANPLQRIRKPFPGRGRVRFLSDEERARLLNACRESRNPYLYTLVVLALMTGGRKEELCSLQWSEVDLERGLIRFINTKTHEPRTVHLLREAHALLAALFRARRPHVPWVFPREDGKQPRDMESGWRTARRRADITNFRFHDLRHTFASYVAMSNGSLRDIAEALGHRKIQNTMVYSHLTQNHTRGVIEQMIRKYFESESEE